MHLDPPQPPPSPLARIPARSRQQAMDWSLVLASQGVEPVIEQTEEAGWALVVGTRDYESSLAAIRQYRWENRRWRWRSPAFKSGFVFDWGSAAWVVLTVVFYWLSDTRPNLRTAGIMDGAAVAQGEWWRLFTATLLHADLGHLATNAVFGFVLIGLAMGRYGTGLGLLGAYLAGAGGNVAAWFVYDGAHHGLGASGVVMGALGLLAAHSFALLKGMPHVLKFALGGFVSGVMLFVLLGTNPDTDVIAHLGGYAGGLMFGAPLALAPNLAQKPLSNLVAGFLFTVLVVVTWVLALIR